MPKPKKPTPVQMDVLAAARRGTVQRWLDAERPFREANAARLDRILAAQRAPLERWLEAERPFREANAAQLDRILAAQRGTSMERLRPSDGINKIL